MKGTDIAMNYLERVVKRKIRRVSWKRMNSKAGNRFKGQEQKIGQYRWIIKNSDEEVIYDTEKDGYDGLLNFPVVIEAFEAIEPTEKNKTRKNKQNFEGKIIFTIDTQLHSIFPSEELEKICIS